CIRTQSICGKSSSSMSDKFVAENIGSVTDTYQLLTPLVVAAIPMDGLTRLASVIVLEYKWVRNIPRIVLPVAPIKEKSSRGRDRKTRGRLGSSNTSL